MKQTIAVDIDDVLVNENHAMMHFVNERYNLALSEDDYDIDAPYWGYWEKVWGLSDEEGAKRYEAYVKAKLAGEVREEPLPGAIDTLRRLKQDYALEIITSRHSVMQSATQKWLEVHYPDIFNAVHFVELWGGGEKVTKARICQEIGAGFLIDDSAEHCRFAHEAEVIPLLFGDYGWNRAEELPADVTRVKNWRAVQEYFDARQA